MSETDFLCIFDYIKRPDIAEHCCNIGQSWNPFEMALIIGQSDRSVKDKHSAWRFIMEVYPDSPTYENKDYPWYESFHLKLKEFMDYENNAIKLLENYEEGSLFEYSIEYQGEDDETPSETLVRRSNTFFTSYEEALRDAQSTCKDYKSGENTITAVEITIKKKYINESSPSIYAVLDPDGCVYNISVFGDIQKVLLSNIDSKLPNMFKNGIYVYLPTPVYEWRHNKPLNENERLLLYKVMYIIDKWDPMQLWMCGCPVDEYNTEAYDIFMILTNNRGIDELNECIKNNLMNEKKCNKFVDVCMEISMKLLKLME